MPCDGPLTAYRPSADAADKRLVFRKDKSGTGVAIKIGCGKCAGCRLEHSRQWAVRVMHEKRLYDAACFVTLTYDDKHLPANHSLVKSDLQNFMKRYRNYAGSGVRFFACGEYGERTFRPHYHVLLLNRDFGDRRFHKMSGENRLYTSNVCDEIWGAGHTLIGDVTFNSAAYVARYCMKKINGPAAEAHYAGREPEFLVMSRRPGIGADYVKRFGQELLDHDKVIVNGVEAALPRYYDVKLLEAGAVSVDGGLFNSFEKIKNRRRRAIDFATRKRESSSRRRLAREMVRAAKLALKGRTL